MLVRRDDLIIGQPAHAWISGQLARAWGNDAFPTPAPREPFCLAAEQHDVGWADADLAPLVQDGRPVAFLAVPRAEHVAIWRGAARRMLAQSRYAALLVSLHGTSLYERIDPDAYPAPLAEQIRAYARGERELQAALSAGLDVEEVDRNRRLILALDRCSLALCHGTATTLDDVPAAGDGSAAVRVEPAAAPGPAAAAGERVRDDLAVRASAATAAHTVAPWPFAADRIVVGCEARLLPGRFDSAAAAAEALAAAPWVPLRWSLSPG